MAASLRCSVFSDGTEGLEQIVARRKQQSAEGESGPCIPMLLVAALEGCATRGRRSFWRSFWSAGALSRFGGPRRARRPRMLHAQSRAKEKRRTGGRTPKPDGTSAPHGDRCGVLGCGSPTPLRGVVVYQQLRDAPELRKPRNSSNFTRSVKARKCGRWMVRLKADSPEGQTSNRIGSDHSAARVSA